MGETRQTRRALLTAAAGGAAALAAHAALGAETVLAADAPLLMNVDNTASASTRLHYDMAEDTGLHVTNTLAGSAVKGSCDNGNGVVGYTGSGRGTWGIADGPGRGIVGTTTEGTGVFGIVGPETAAPADTTLTGVFGYSPPGDGVTTAGAGVWGDSPDYGVYGSGGIGVYGDGEPGGWGVYGWSDSNTGIYGEADTGTALKGASASGYGLYVSGKVKFATRSGRSSVAKGKTSWTKTGLTGVTSGCIVIAVLQTVETGTWVRAAVAGTGKITVYFNRALPSSSYVGWLILN